MPCFCCFVDIHKINIFPSIVILPLCSLFILRIHWKKSVCIFFCFHVYSESVVLVWTIFFSIFSYYFATHNYTCSVFVCMLSKHTTNLRRKSIQTNSVSLSSVLFFFSAPFCAQYCCSIRLFFIVKKQNRIDFNGFSSEIRRCLKEYREYTTYKYTTGTLMFFVES